MDTLTHHIKQYALEIGFDLVGIASADSFTDHQEITLERMREGLMDGLPWYGESRVRRGCNPSELLPGARSIITVGISYLAPEDDDEVKRQLGGKGGALQLG